MREIKPPPLEKELGLEHYLSKTPGISGVIKKVPEDFLVEEITPEGEILEINKEEEGEVPFGEKQDYIHFTLQKYNWDTLRAIKEISKRLRVSRKRFGFAGTKDKRAITTQRVSLWNQEIENLMKVRIKDIEIKTPRYAPERINLGQLWGNRFTVKIRETNLTKEEVEERIKTTIKELNHQIPSYFGVQRFGIQRPITHLVGKEILKKNFKRAVMIYLAGVFPTEREEAREARKILKESEDFKEALKKFPTYLGYEKAILNHLVNQETDFIGALRKLPKKLRWMFVHAYQSYIFNKTLSYYLKKGEEVSSLPLPGYDSELDKVTLKIIQKEKVSLEDFKINSMPELSSRGETRPVFFEINDFKIHSISQDNVTLQFSLPKGTYATVFLREIIKDRYW